MHLRNGFKKCLGLFISKRSSINDAQRPGLCAGRALLFVQPGTEAQKRIKNTS